MGDMLHVAIGHLPGLDLLVECGRDLLVEQVTRVAGDLEAVAEATLAAPARILVHLQVEEMRRAAVTIATYYSILIDSKINFQICFSCQVMS